MLTQKNNVEFTEDCKHYPERLPWERQLAYLVVVLKLGNYKDSIIN